MVRVFPVRVTSRSEFFAFFNTLGKWEAPFYVDGKLLL